MVQNIRQQDDPQESPRHLPRAPLRGRRQTGRQGRLPGAESSRWEPSLKMLLWLGLVPVACGLAAPFQDVVDDSSASATDSTGSEEPQSWPDLGGHWDEGGDAGDEGPGSGAATDGTDPTTAAGDAGDGDTGDGDDSSPGGTTTAEGGDDATPPPEVDPNLALLRLEELRPDPPGADGTPASPEYVELLYVGASAVQLDALSLEVAGWPDLDAGKLDLMGVALMPGDRLLVARSTAEPDFFLSACQGSSTCRWFTGGPGMTNASGVVRVRAAHESLEVTVYGTATLDRTQLWTGPGAPAPKAPTSLCRISDGGNPVHAADWEVCESSPATATPALPPPPPPVPPVPPGALLLVEVLANPPGPSTTEKLNEYVELINVTQENIDLANVRIGDDLVEGSGVDPLSYRSGDGGCRPATCLAPGQRALIVGNAYSGPIGSALVLQTDDSTIADAGLGAVEPVVLWNELGQSIATYRAWRDPLASPNPTQVEQAVHRIEYESPDIADNWVFDTSTPGFY